MNASELRQLVDAADELRGWDWTTLRVDRDPVPSDYLEVVRRYLTPSSYVLDTCKSLLEPWLHDGGH